MHPKIHVRVCFLSWYNRYEGRLLQSCEYYLGHRKMQLWISDTSRNSSTCEVSAMKICNSVVNDSSRIVIITHCRGGSIGRAYARTPKCFSVKSVHQAVPIITSPRRVTFNLEFIVLSRKGWSAEMNPLRSLDREEYMTPINDAFSFSCKWQLKWDGTSYFYNKWFTQMTI